MKFFKSISISAVLALSLSAFAAVSTDDAKVGTMLDASGVALAGINQNDLPLPPGQWKIVGRIDHSFVIFNYTNGDRTSPMVSLTLINEDKTSPIVAGMIDFPVDRIKVTWTNSVCQDRDASFIETLGTTNNTLNYACAKVFPRQSGSFKEYVKNIANNKNIYWKDRFTSLTPYIDALPESYNWNYFYVTKDNSRRMTAVFVTKTPKEVKAGDPADTAARTFATSVAQAYLDWVDNKDASIPAYPAQ